MYKATILHPDPDFGRLAPKRTEPEEQTCSKKSLEKLLRWLAYMVSYHQVEVLKIEHNGQEIKDYKIPKW